MDHIVLRNEIQTDPLAIGYSALVAAGNDAGVATMLNTPIAGQWIFDGRMASNVLFELIDAAEYAALNADQKNVLFGVLGMGEVDLTGANALAIMQSLFANPSNTRTNIINRVRRNPTRAEMLFGIKSHVTDLDVALALRG